MALHPDFPSSPYAILNPEVRWFPADETLRETGMDKLMPPLVSQLRRKVKDFRDSGYVGAAETSKSLLNWWFREAHLQERFDGTSAEFCYFFAQREALETIVYLYDVAGAKDKFDLMRFDGSGVASAGMFDESWRRYLVKMATGSGKTKVLSLALAWSFFHKLSDGRIVVVETKGQVDEDVPQKMARLRQWCEDLNDLQSEVYYPFAFVDADDFKKYAPTNFRQVLEGFRAYR